MNWLWLALASGFAVAVKNVIIRKLVFLTDKRVILYSKYLFVSIFAVLLFCFMGIPKIKSAFYPSILVASIVDVIAAWYFLKAIESAQLAKTFPLVAFTPIFLLGTSFLMLGELPTFTGIIGILLIVCGAYLLRVESIRVGVLEPIRLLFKENGQRQMLLAAFLFSLLAVFFKKAILNSSPFFAFSVTQVLSTLFLTIFFLNQNTLSSVIKKTWEHFNWLFFAGIVGFFAGLTLFAAFKLGLAAYVVSIKRTSILFTILLGYIFFKEDHIVKSLLIGTLMVCGIFLISVN